MIRIVTEKTRVPSSSSLSTLAKTIQAEAANAAAEGFAGELKKNGVGNKACENHPTHTNTIVIKALDTKEVLRVEKRGFCCREFENSIQITIKR